MLQRACSRSIEIIGEAAKNVSSALKRTNPKIPWKQLAAMRDKLIHQYFGVNWLIVWDVIENHLPILRNDIGALVSTIRQKKIVKGISLLPADLHFVRGAWGRNSNAENILKDSLAAI